MTKPLLAWPRSLGSGPSYLEDARQLSRYAASHGLANAELCKAINEVLHNAPEPSSCKLVESEQRLFSEISKMLKELDISSIDQIRRYYTRHYRILYGILRYAVLLIMLLSTALAIPLTFVFNQTSTRVAQIRELNDLVRTEGVYGAGRTLRMLSSTPGRELAAGEHRERLDDSVQSINANPEADLSRLDARVQLLVRPPRMMDMIQTLINDFYLRFLTGHPENGGILTMFYYAPSQNGSLLNFKDAGAVTQQLQTSEADFVFISSILGSGILPIIYGTLGAAVFLARKYLFSSAELYKLSNPLAEMIMRIGLGAVAGVAVSWFQLPKAAEQITATPLAVAFAAGYSIDIIFSFLDKIITVFDFKQEGASRDKG